MIVRGGTFGPVATNTYVVAELKALPLRVDSPLAGSTLQQLRALRGQ